MKRILLIVAGVVVLGMGGLGATVQMRWDRTFEAPASDLVASTDPAVIERGRYLVTGPAHCTYCHTAGPEEWARLDAGEEVDLAGGQAWTFPPGTFRSRNITPDTETGIGRRTDAELVRILRYGIRHDGRAAIPMMPFQNLSDDDMVAIISYLRSRPAVRNEVPEHELSPLGKAVMAFMMEPRGPEGSPPAHTPAGPSIELGEYLANSVANCRGCHTQVNMVDGSEVGPPFAGGGEMPSDADPTKIYVSPNLTPDPETGRIASWTEDQFVARFRAGKNPAYADSHMPWMAFGRMTDDDLRSLYRYLQSLEPVVNNTGPSLQAKGE